jgi:hypothetical protein
MIIYVKGTGRRKTGTNHKKGISKAILRQQAVVFTSLIFSL